MLAAGLRARGVTIVVAGVAPPQKTPGVGSGRGEVPERGMEAAACREALSRVAARAEGCDARDLGVVLDRAVHAAVVRSLRRERVQEQQPKAFPKEEPQAPLLQSQAVEEEGVAWRPSSAVSEQPDVVSVSEKDLLDALQGHIPAAFWALAQQRQQQGGVGGLEGWRDVGGMHEVRCTLLRPCLCLVHTTSSSEGPSGLSRFSHPSLPPSPGTGCPP